MQRYLSQSQHNQNFHTSVCQHSPDQYFDWKITCLFYDAIHCLKALAEHKAVNIGITHTQIEANVSPKVGATTMPLPPDAWSSYKNLYRYSRTARYTGYTPVAAFEVIKRMDHNHCLQLLNEFKSYVRSEGVPLP